MTAALTWTKAVKPAYAQTALLRVVRASALSPGFVRVTLTGADATLGDTFRPMGYDQWVRLFLPVRRDLPPLMPGGGLDGWYTTWLTLPEAERAHIRNYTVRAARQVGAGWELDIDFVVHRNSQTGQVDGLAAGWAVQARPGDPVGMLDQGTIYDTAEVAGTSVIVADATGVPAAEGIARSLPGDARALLILEVPTDADRRPIGSQAALDVRWVQHAPGAPPGAAALAELESLTLSPSDYVYAVGESTFAQRARRTARAAGLPKESIDFCAYWRAERRRRS